MKKTLLLLCLFFLFNTLEIDSNSNKILLYDKNEIYEEDYFIIYFKNLNSKKLKELINVLDIEILSYIIDDKKYYYNSIDDLTNKYLENLNEEERLYYIEYGIIIDGICVICTNNELIKLENLTKIY